MRIIKDKHKTKRKPILTEQKNIQGNTVFKPNGKPVLIRKNLPAKCSVPWQCCLQCFTRIHKNNKRCIEVKLCKQCIE